MGLRKVEGHSEGHRRQETAVDCEGRFEMRRCTVEMTRGRESKGTGSTRPAVWGGLACATGVLGLLLLQWLGRGRGSAEVAVVTGLAAQAGYGLGWGWAHWQQRDKRAGRLVAPRELERAEVIWDFTGSEGSGYRVVWVEGRMLLWRAEGGRWWVSDQVEEVLWEIEAMTSGVGQ
jgi:hypothetical protein